MAMHNLSVKNVAVRIGARRLLEMADRVLGAKSTRADRYSYINLLLSQMNDELDLGLRTGLRVSAYEQLFGTAKSQAHIEAALEDNE